VTTEPGVQLGVSANRPATARPVAWSPQSRRPSRGAKMMVARNADTGGSRGLACCCMRAILAVAVVPCAIMLAAPAQADDTDAIFMQVISNDGISVPQPVTQAQAICGVLDTTSETFVDVVNGMVGYNAQQGTSITQSDAAFFSGAAIQAYCPKYKTLIGHSG
jgi:Protein of unknown function (DUF732)